MDAPAMPSRYRGLDAIRGVAVMGILAMNIVAFALPFAAYANPAAGGPPSSADLAAWAFNFLFVDSKMRGLFSMLFGASTLLVIERAEGSGRSAARTHYARMAWLALFGLAHFYLIWFGDILFLYSACGLLLFWFRALSIRASSSGPRVSSWSSSCCSGRCGAACSPLRPERCRATAAPKCSARLSG